MKLSNNFDSSEFACHCGKCKLKPINPDLVDLLEDVRRHFGRPVTIMSGYRCEAHNKAVGGAKNSQHMLGIAADIKVSTIRPAAVAAYLETKYQTDHGIGRYQTFTHVDVRHNKARWVG